MVYSYNNLAAQISASKSQNNDFGRAVSLCLLIRNCRFLVVIPQTIFSNRMVTVHIKPTAPHHITVLTASVKKNSTTCSFTRVIFVRLLKNLAKDGTQAKSGRFALHKIFFKFDLNFPLNFLEFLPRKRTDCRLFGLETIFENFESGEHIYNTSS